MKVEYLEKMKDFYSKLPPEQQAEWLSLLLDEIIREKKEKAECWNKKWNKKSSKKLISGSTTHTNPEEKTRTEEKTKTEEKIKVKDFVYLTQKEYDTLKSEYWSRTTSDMIDRLNNYIWSTWTKYKSHYFTILNRIRKEWIPKRYIETKTRVEQVQKQNFYSENKQNETNSNSSFNRRTETDCKELF